MSNPLDWNALTKEERIDAIRPLVEKGQSSGKIALHFVNASRNAIISYCTRHKIALQKKRGWPGEKSKVHAKVQSKSSDRKPHQTHAIPSIPIDRPAAQAPDILALAPISKSRAFEPIDGLKPVHLADLTSSQCHWPVNGLEGIEPIFCGAAASHVYCTSHRRLAYQPRGHQGAI